MMKSGSKETIDTPRKKEMQEKEEQRQFAEHIDLLKAQREQF